MTSFTEDMRRRGMEPAQPDARAAHDHLQAPGWAGSLHVSPCEPIVVVKRLRLADDETMAIETLHVRASLVPGLSADDLESHSFYTLLSERYGIDIVGGLQTIEPTVTNEEESDGARRPAPLAGVPLRADDPLARR